MFTTKKITCLILNTIAMVSLCEAGNIKFEFPNKCGINDGECQTKLADLLISKYAKSGIPEIGLPAFDPYEIKDMTVSVLGMVDLTMVDGKVEGLANCPFSKIETNIEKGFTTTESFCESVKISGHYTVKAGPLVQTLAGKNVSGEGNGDIQIDKMVLKTKIPLKVEKRDDGEIYIIMNPSKAEYSTNDIEKITFQADNIMLGDEEVSQSLTSFMNKNWKVIYKSFGKIFSDKVMDVAFEYLTKAYELIPAKLFISDDLTPYMKQ